MLQLDSILVTHRYHYTLYTQHTKQQPSDSIFWRGAQVSGITEWHFVHKSIDYYRMGLDRSGVATEFFFGRYMVGKTSSSLEDRAGERRSNMAKISLGAE